MIFLNQSILEVLLHYINERESELNDYSAYKKVVNEIDKKVKEEITEIKKSQSK